MRVLRGVLVLGLAVAAGLGMAATAVAAPAGDASLQVVRFSSQSASADGLKHFTEGAGVLKDGAAAAAPVSSIRVDSPATPASSGFGAYTDCLEDGGLDIESCVTLNYYTYSCGNIHCGGISSVNLKYSILDKSTSVLASHKWVEGASGRCNRGCTGSLGGTKDFGWHATSNNTTYTYNGAWAGKYTELNKAAGEQRGGTSTLDWDFRGSSKQLVLNPVLNDSGDGGSER